MGNDLGDLLATWMSETGSGSIADLRMRAQWLARTVDAHMPPHAGGRWLRDMSSLGHCEVDWKGGNWAMAPAAVVRLPLADGLAVLTGARRPRLMRALADAEVWIEEAHRAAPEGELPLPRTLYLPFDSEAELIDELRAVGLPYAGCGADRISRALIPVVPKAQAAPPSRGNRLERLRAFFPRLWEVARTTDANPPDGLYREQVNGRWAHLLRRSGTWLSCGLDAGLFSELARQGRVAIRWRADPTRTASGTGTVFVDWGASLPALHSRALVLCSGLPPRFGATAETVIFDNVPRSIALRVCASLGQKFSID